ncbi:MAG: hypothetical protein Q7T11_01315 [Deltaproteobacteria bacterium]|nr:hypothetical protein [Deltaproteobacteria bacterium]
MKTVSFLSFFLFPALAFACPVCFSEEGGSLNAYRFSTFFLTFLPFLTFFGFGYWFWRQLKKRADL